MYLEMPSVENTGITGVSILCYYYDLNLYTEHFHLFLFFKIPPFTFWQKKVDNNRANLTKFCWMLILEIQHILQCIGRRVDWHKGKNIFYQHTLTYHALFLTHKQNDRCSFLCTWTNFQQGQMILCIATANLSLIYGFFFFCWSFYYMDRKKSQIAQPQVHFVTRVFHNFFKGTWHLLY